MKKRRTLLAAAMVLSIFFAGFAYANADANPEDSLVNPALSRSPIVKTNSGIVYNGMMGNMEENDCTDMENHMGFQDEDDMLRMHNAMHPVDGSSSMRSRSCH